MKLEGVKQLDDGPVFVTDEGKFKLETVTDRIVRVRYTKDEEFSERGSLMILPEAGEGVDWKLVEDDRSYRLITDQIKVRVAKGTGAIEWMNEEGAPLVAEPEGGGKRLAPYVGEAESGASAPLEREEGDKLYSTKLELDFAEGEAIYGLGQHEEGILNYRGERQYLYQHNMKASLPLIVSTKGYGILWDSYSLGIFNDDGGGSYFWTECDPELDFYFVYGPDFDEIVSGFRELTGSPSMFPRWAYGYVQSKERYKSKDELLSVIKEYRDREIPIDCIVQDWQYWPEGTWSEKRFDEERFDRPDEFIEELHSLGAKLMISIWPNMKGGSNEEEMKERGFLIENPEARDPYDVSTYDAFDPQARKLYWQHTNEGLFSHGVDAWWCDSSEPFSKDWGGPVKPETFRRTEMNVELLKKTLGPEFINAYSLMHTEGVYEGQRGETEEKRVVNLTRSGYPGQQRYGAITWSGDIEASWERLRAQIAEGLNFTVSGNPKWTLDIGGFFVEEGDGWFWKGNFPEGCEDEGYRELYVRWFQFGSFLPMFRSHGTDTPREVWRFGESGDETYETLVEFDRLRYRLLPYIYSLAGWETQRDYTTYRNLAFDFRQDERVYDIDDQFGFGPALMVCPVTEPMYYGPGSEELKGKAKAREVYLPQGTTWYDFWTGVSYEGGQTILADAPLEKIPLFVRAGSIIPMGPQVEHTGQSQGGPWELRLYPGRDGEFSIYEDEGDGYGYEDGAFSFTPIRWDDGEEKLIFGEREGSFPGMEQERNFDIVKVEEGRGTGVERAQGERVEYEGKEKEVSI